MFGSLLLSFNFLEEAGEVQFTKRISGDPALESTVREYEHRRRQMAEAAGKKIGKKHAPLMFLVVLVALEFEVLKERQPLFVLA